MLWTVQKYSKGPEDQNVCQKILLKDSYQVALILASIGFSLDLLITGIILLLKSFCGHRSSFIF